MVGRPKKYNIKEMIAVILQYTLATEIPVLKEVCYLNNWNYDTVMRLQRDNEELLQSIKRLLNKKEVQLEKLALFGAVDKTMAIFSLKQLGWKDKQEDADNQERVTIIDDFQ